MSMLAAILLGSTLTLADLRNLVNLGQPRISPDGTRIAVSIGKRNFDKDLTENDLVLVDVRSHAQRKLLRNVRIVDYEWSPNGASLAYIAAPASGEPKSAQLFVLPMNGGEPLQLTQEKNGVEDFVWRPDGKILAYSAQPEAPNQKALDHGENAFNVTEEAWTEQSTTPTHDLYEISASGTGKPHHIGNASLKVVGGFTYAADGRSIFVTRLPAGASPNQYLATEIVNVRLSDGRVNSVPTLSATQGDPSGRWTARIWLMLSQILPARCKQRLRSPTRAARIRNGYRSRSIATSPASISCRATHWSQSRAIVRNAAFSTLVTERIPPFRSVRCKSAVRRRSRATAASRL